MRHFRKFMNVSIALTAGVAVQAATPDADARSQAAILGNPFQAVHQGCFNEASGGPAQVNCTPPAGVQLETSPRDVRVPAWVMPLVYDSAGSTRVLVTAQGSGNGANIVQCRSFHAFQNGSATFSADARTVLNTNAVELLHVDGRPGIPMSLPPFGAAWVTCWMEPSTRLFHISY